MSYENFSLIPVILSGGSGSRLWPVSRKSFPKQFWPLLSTKTLLQETILRGIAGGTTRPIVVCNVDHRFIIAEQLRAVGEDRACILLEPEGRNSAPAISAAAFLIAEENPEAVMWIMAADAAIQDEKALLKDLKVAVQTAMAGYIVTFGIKPTRPETGYGYIQCGVPLGGTDAVYCVDQFLEKPDINQAMELVQNERNLWNSGMFVVKARVLLEEIARFEPKVYACVKEAVAYRSSDMDFERLAEEPFKQSPNISIDYAVAERTRLAAVVLGTFGWSDVGSWDALWELMSKDAHGNVVSGDDIFLERAHHCYVHAENCVTTLLGVKNLIVVVTNDAVMVAQRECAQSVKTMVARLIKEGRPEAKQHNKIYRPWGFYECLIRGDRFQVKRIVVKPGQRLSLQKHFHRAEHWVVVEGTALVTRETEQMMVRENESVYLPLGTLHRLENPGRLPLTLIEVQSGSYLGEDDIIRVEDDYNSNF